MSSSVQNSEMSEDDQTKPDEVTEKIEIYSTEDEKIKSIGEVLTNASSRKILQLLFKNEMTANQIAQKTNISLQLVKYHINKMQEIGIVKISKLGKNIKAQDMKYYKTTKFAIVILPSIVSDKAKESKLLIRSFKTIYRFAGIAIAGIAAWFTTLSMQSTTQIPQPVEETEIAIPKSLPSTDVETGIGFAPPAPSTIEDNLGDSEADYSTKESLPQESLEPTDVTVPSFGGPSFESDLFLPIIITIAVVGIGVTIELFLRIYYHSKKKQLS